MGICAMPGVSRRCGRCALRPRPGLDAAEPGPSGATSPGAVWHRRPPAGGPSYATGPQHVPRPVRRTRPEEHDHAW